MKTLFVTFVIGLSAFTSYAQTDDVTNLHKGGWADGISIVWQCPETGPVIKIPFIFVDGAGSQRKGFISCGMEDGTKLEKPKSTTERSL